MRLQPGLVGGHCIGVDPYYLLHRSEKAGHIPDIIRLSREINDGMPREVARRLVRAMINRDLPVRGAKVMVLGATFKEDCPDIRNTKVADLVLALREWGFEVSVDDPHAVILLVQLMFLSSVCGAHKRNARCKILIFPASASRVKLSAPWHK